MKLSFAIKKRKQTPALAAEGDDIFAASNVTTTTTNDDDDNYAKATNDEKLVEKEKMEDGKEQKEKKKKAKKSNNTKDQKYDSSKFGLQTFKSASDSSKEVDGNVNNVVDNGDENVKMKTTNSKSSFDPKRELAITEAPTTDSYKEMPIHEFGISMLKGMGWNGEYDDED